MFPKFRLNKKLKGNALKALKQNLTDRINQSKSEGDLIKWHKTFEYYPVLQNDFDWDYMYIFNLLEFKLKRMSEYFYNHNLPNKGKQCDKAINILRAGYKSDIILSKDLYNYVNTRNIKRFNVPSLTINNDKLWRDYGLVDLRVAKAKALFWKYLHHYIENWWE